eukprot:scaffold652344_cov31-Prasinocladus_malaysianus.AAC.1
MALASRPMHSTLTDLACHLLVGAISHLSYDCFNDIPNILMQKKKMTFDMLVIIDFKEADLDVTLMVCPVCSVRCSARSS